MNPHYFSQKQTSKIKQETIDVIFKGKKFPLVTGSGVFSKNWLDKGSEVLLSSAQISASGKVLDLGCGYGAIGIILKIMHPTITMVMTDVNERAVKLAKKNVASYKLKIQVYAGEGYTAIKNEIFDCILLNPPQHAGKQICFRLIEEALPKLNKKGSLQIVARHKKGGKALKERMEQVFGNVTVIGRKAGYQVYKSMNNRYNQL